MLQALTRRLDVSKREIANRIKLCGIAGDYRVVHDIPGQAILCYVSSVKIGNAIVRALRELASKESANGKA